MEAQTKRAGKAHVRPAADARKDRRSATGMSGAPKKGGRGGKFTWSGDQRYAGDDDVRLMEKGALDAKDPNFEDPEEAQKDGEGKGEAAAAEAEGVLQHDKAV